MTDGAIATATRIGHETALGDLHCLRGSLLLQQDGIATPSRSSSGAWTHPTRGRAGASGPSTCSAAAWHTQATGARTRRTCTPRSRRCAG